MIPANLLAYIIPIVVVVLIIAYAIRILREYERGVIFTLGRFQNVRGPGLILVIPVICLLYTSDAADD